MKIKQGNLNFDQSGRAYPDDPHIKENWECVWEFEGKRYIIVGDDEHKEWEVIKDDLPSQGDQTVNVTLSTVESDGSETTERTFNKKEVEEMCLRSYLRGMSIQYDTMTKKRMKPTKAFVEWVKQLIDECPVGKFK